jgi:acetyltransferase-like isoleucine patch superfamily enzyme
MTLQSFLNSILFFKRKIKSKLKYFGFNILYPKRISLSNSVYFGNLFKIQFDISNSIVYISNGVQFRDNCRITSGIDSRLFISENVFFNNGCSINCLGKITIGNNCQFGEDVKFYDHNHTYTDTKKNINQQGYSVGEIIIGNNCWIQSVCIRIIRLKVYSILSTIFENIANNSV